MNPLQATIRKRFDRIGYRIRRAGFDIFLKLVRRIPFRVRYWVVINAWADATQGEWGGEEVPAVRAHQLLERMK